MPDRRPFVCIWYTDPTTGERLCVWVDDDIDTRSLCTTPLPEGTANVRS